MCSISHTQLVDGDFDLHANYTIQNADVVTLLFNLIPHMQLSKQLQFMDNFTKLVEKSPLNQSLCCHKSVIFDILQLIPSVQHNDTFLGTNLSRASLVLSTESSELTDTGISM